MDLSVGRWHSQRAVSTSGELGAGAHEERPNEEVNRVHVVRGGVAALWKTASKEVLLEGGAGTGKTLGCLVHANWTAREYPGCRILFVRKTRKSLNDSVLKDWEELVLHQGHEALSPKERSNRDYYKYASGTEIVCGGLDNVDRLMSTNFDRIYVFEATEITLDDLQKMISRLRNGRAKYHQIVCDCNPGPREHFLNQRATVGTMKRLLSRHEDNPKWYDAEKKTWTVGGADYMDTLEQLSGHIYQRLKLHQWVSAEGVIWDNWDGARDMIPQEAVPKINWSFVSMDFGYRGPGTLQVWGVGSHAMFRLAEIYRREQTLSWWGDRLIELQDEYGFKTGVGDSAEPRSIRYLNDYLHERSLPFMLRPVDKGRGKIHGLDLVRRLMAQRRLVLVRDAVRFPDMELRKLGWPWSTETEIPSFCWREKTPGDPRPEEPDQTCADHGCDAMIYAAIFRYRKDLSEPEEAKTYADGTYGQIYGTPESLEADRRKNEGRGRWVPRRRLPKLGA